MKLTVTENTERLARQLECLEKLRRTRVEVGLPEGAPGRSRFLLALHERGAPVMRIPPRPVIGPALAQASVREEMADALAGACESALAGDAAGMDAAYEAAGQAGVRGIRDYIDAGITPGNAPVTVSGGWVYNRVAKAGVPVGGKGFDRPMVDTGELYHSFDYEVKS